MAITKKGTHTPHTTNDRLELAQAIHALTAHGSKFVEALTAIVAFDEQKLNEIDIKISSKVKEYEDLMRKVEMEYKNEVIATQQRLSEHQLTAATALAQSFNKVIVDKDEFQALLATAKAGEKQYEAQIAQLAAEHKKSHEASVRAIETMAALKEKATHASLVAKTEQQSIEIEVLQRQIKSQAHELAEQRELTKAVAQANAKGAITQSFGKTS